MCRTRFFGLIFALLFIAWSALPTMAQDGPWGKYSAAGRQALEQRDFPTAE